jgi:3-phosphoshikimate 1-carboxyvinyltransferase
VTRHKEIVPLSRPALADGLRVPGSKSITNRVLLLAALAEGETVLRHALFSDDTRHMAAALRALGVAVEASEATGTLRVRGDSRFGPPPARTAPAAPAIELYTGNAGTAARFLTALACVRSAGGPCVIDGSERMRRRPIADLVSALRTLGAAIECPTGCPPVTVREPVPLRGSTRVDGSRSSQYLSALLMIAPYALEDVEIQVTGESIARPYIDMTVAMMGQFGVNLRRDGYRAFRIAAGQRYRPQAEYEIEADASSAHYLLAAAALTAGRVRVEGIGTASLQGDVRFATVLERMGATVTWGEKEIAVQGPARLRGIDVDMGDISDTAMTLAVLAPFATTPVRIRNVAHLRIQESERIAAVANELRKLGGRVIEHDDGWEIEPSTLHGGEVETYDDHRIAMAFALVGLRVPGVVILDPDCVGKTFPGYFETLEKLRTV